MAGFGGMGMGGGAGDSWATNEEAIRNLGYMQMKKTHDAAMVIMGRVYGERPRFNYYFGGSQGGREGLTVVQRYPADYDGVTADVPIVGFSTLMLAPELIRIQEKPKANWVTRSKVNTIKAQCLSQIHEQPGKICLVLCWVTYIYPWNAKTFQASCSKPAAPSASQTPRTIQTCR
jgi:hypothetical protein